MSITTTGFRADAAATIVTLLPVEIRNRVDEYSDFINSDGSFEVTLDNSNVLIRMTLADEELTVAVCKAVWVIYEDEDEDGFWNVAQFPDYDQNVSTLKVQYRDFFKLRALLPPLTF